jgi:hypothetical protein
MKASVPSQGTQQSSMWPFVGLTAVLFIALAISSAYMRRAEITANWSQYRSDPLFMFSSFLFKPDDDPRSAAQFTMDNFSENITALLDKVFAVFLQPVFQILKLVSDAMEQSLGSLFNMRSLLANMWTRFNEGTDVFQRRFNGVAHQLRMTYTKLYNSLNKTMGVTVSSVYAGLSYIYSITSFIDFMIKLCIIILLILVVMVILLFFVLFPVMPLIASAVAVIAVTASGAAVGGMADTFCFAGHTQVLTRDGPRAIKDLVLGTVLADGGVVKGVMEFDTVAYDLYAIDGVQVSGTHVVYKDGVPVHVKDVPDATLTDARPTRVYCLITTSRRIPVQGLTQHHTFADWEELSEMDDLKIWHRHVFEALNPGAKYISSTAKALLSEAVLTGATRVRTPDGPRPLSTIVPGSVVLDADGTPTRVAGIVWVSSSEVEAVVDVEPGAQASIAAWLRKDTAWRQASQERHIPVFNTTLYHLFTESGTFQLEGGTGVRDFTDVGPESISSTYDWVLESLAKNIPAS